MPTRELRTYTKDFKRDALKYLEEHPEMKIKSVAEYLGIPKETLYDWSKKANREKILGEGVSSSGPMTDAEKELARLQRENRDLKDALEVLKKAISILND